MLDGGTFRPFRTRWSEQEARNAEWPAYHDVHEAEHRDPFPAESQRRQAQAARGSGGHGEHEHEHPH